MEITLQEYQQAKIDRNLDIISKVASGAITVIMDNSQAPASEQNESSSTAEAPNSDDKTEETGFSAEQYEKQLADERYAREQLAEQLRLKEVEQEVLRKQALEASQKIQQSTQHQELPEQEVIDLSQEPEYETEYDRMIGEMERMKKVLLSGQGSLTPKEKAALKDFEESKQKEEARREEERRQAILQKEFNSFWNENPNYKPSKNFNEIETDYADLRVSLFKSGMDEFAVEKTMAELVNPKTKEATTAKLTSVGIKIPQEFDKVYETLSVYRYMNGQKVDPVTGRVIPVVGAGGNNQILASMTDAYFLMNRNTILANERRKSAVEVQQKISSFNNSARTLPAESTAPAPTDDNFSPQRMAVILAEAKQNPILYKTDPQKVAIFNEVKRRLGL